MRRRVVAINNEKGIKSGVDDPLNHRKKEGMHFPRIIV